MTHPLPEQMSDYLDGELPPAEETQLRAHLATCAECAALLVDLQRVLARAQALEDRPPRHDLWPGVAAAIGATPARAPRRLQVSMPVLLAASIALMLLSGGTVAFLLQSGRGLPSTAQAPTPLPAAPTTTLVRQEGARGYDLAISNLEAQLRAGRPKLDSVTVRVVEQKLEMIDRAIGEAERALATDPASSYLNGHLTETRLRKLDLLRRVAALSRSVS